MEQYFTAKFFLTIFIPMALFFLKAYVEARRQIVQKKSFNHGVTLAFWWILANVIYAVVGFTTFWEFVGFNVMAWGLYQFGFDPVHNQFTGKWTWYFNPDGHSKLDRIFVYWKTPFRRMALLACSIFLSWSFLFGAIERLDNANQDISTYVGWSIVGLFVLGVGFLFLRRAGVIEDLIERDWSKKEGE